MVYEDRRKRLSEVFGESGLTQSQLAGMAGCAQPEISGLLSGQRNLTDALARKLAKPLDTNIPWLMYGAGSKRGRAHMTREQRDEALLTELELVAEERGTYGTPGPIRLRVAGRVAADALSNVEWVEGEDFGQVVIPNHLRYYEVAGFSMAPVLWDKQHVGVDWMQEPENGDIGAFALRDGRQFVKRLWIENGQFRLVSLRPTDPRRAEPPEPDLVVKRGQIKRMGKVKIILLY